MLPECDTSMSSASVNALKGAAGHPVQYRASDPESVGMFKVVIQ